MERVTIKEGKAIGLFAGHEIGWRGDDGIFKTVEADETYFGKTDVQPKTRTDGTPFKSKGKKRGPAGKRAVFALVERGGSVRSFHV